MMNATRWYKLSGDSVIVAALCAALFVICLLVYTQGNSFPYYSHPDEQSKVAQLLEGRFNFRHPQLLLVSTDLVRKALGQSDGYQRITVSGRWVSAAFAAGAVVLFTLLGWRTFGLLGAWCVGLMVAVCPVVGVTAHFLKEDASLLFGFSAFLLAMHLWAENPNRKRLICVGLACGLAASAKYIGVACLLVAVPVVFVYRKSRENSSRPINLMLLLGSSLLVFIAINWSMLEHQKWFVKGLGRSIEVAAHGRKDTGIPNLDVIWKILDLHWAVLSMAAIGIACHLTFFRRSSIIGWMLLVTLVLSTAMLVSTPLAPQERYLLIVFVSLYAMAGLALVMLAKLYVQYRATENPARVYWSATVASVLLFALIVPEFVSKAVDAFDQADARSELIAWVNSTLEEDAVLAVPRVIRLPGVNKREPADPAIQFERKPVTLKMGQEIPPGFFEKMGERGVTHVVVRNAPWLRYLKATGEEGASHPRVVWSVPPQFEGKNRHLRGDLIVLQL